MHSQVTNLQTIHGDKQLHVNIAIYNIIVLHTAAYIRKGDHNGCALNIIYMQLIHTYAKIQSHHMKVCYTLYGVTAIHT